MADFKVFFLRGLAVLLPSVLSIWIIVYAYRFVDQSIAEPINAVTRTAVIRVMTVRVPDYDQSWAADNYPDWYNVTDAEYAAEVDRRAAQKAPKISEVELKSRMRAGAFQAWWEQHWYLNAIGLVIAVLLIYLAGRIFGGFVGRKIAGRIERLIGSVPILKQIYPYVKQLVDFVIGESKIEFNRVVLVEYPRRGIWSVGFLTGHTMNDIAAVAGLQPTSMVTVFIPSSPTPFTGYTISLPRDEIRELPITVEEALRFTVSGGVLIPESQVLDPLAAGSDQILQTPDEMVKSNVKKPDTPTENQ
jgi:uncharacterized membrane protein